MQSVMAAFKIHFENSILYKSTHFCAKINIIFLPNKYLDIYNKKRYGVSNR